jgi:hypothetical protein
MRRPTAAALFLAAVLALPAPAGAKGFASASVCGANGCHPVARGAARAGIDASTRASAPSHAEPFFTVRMRARVSSGRVVEVFALQWLPRAAVTRPFGERSWTRPGAALDRALREAARGLRPHPAAALGSVAGGAPAARVAEVFTPAARDATSHPASPTPSAVAAAAASLLALAAAIGSRARRRRARRRTAPLAPRTR